MYLTSNTFFLESLQCVSDVLETGKWEKYGFCPHKISMIFLGGEGHSGSIFCGAWSLHTFGGLFTKKKTQLKTLACASEDSTAEALLTS